MVLYVVHRLEVAECHVQLLKVSVFLLSDAVKLQEPLLGCAPLQWLMLVFRQVVVVLVHTLNDGIEILHAILLNNSFLRVLIIDFIMLSLALNVVI